MTLKNRTQTFGKLLAQQPPPPHSGSVAAHLANAFRALVFGRGRRKRFGVPPVVRQVRKLFTTHPFLTNAVTYGCMFVGAELCQQIARERELRGHNGRHLTANHLDVGSLKRYAVWGGVVVPPIYHKWYEWLDRAYNTCAKSGGGGTRVVMAQKLALDQFVLTPFVLAAFFVCMAAMEGQEDVVDECRRKFVTTFVADCVFWLPVQAFNFRFVPKDMRVAFLAVATFIWVNVLCYIKMMKKKVPSTDAQQ